MDRHRIRKAPRRVTFTRSECTSNFSNYVGSEIDLVATYAFKRYASLQAGIGHFFVGDYVNSSLAGIGGAKDATFVYAQFTLNF